MGTRQAAARKQVPPTLKRKIYFYRIDAGATGDGKPRRPDMAALAASFNAVEQLAYEPGRRYMVHPDGHLFVTPHRHQWPLRFQYTLTRLVNLPQEEQRGRTRPLNIATDAGLAETTHIVAFPDGILGAEFNFYGPKVASLRDYLSTKADGVFPDVSFPQLLRRDVLQELRRIENLKLMTLRIRSNFIETVRDLDRDFFGALDAVRSASDAWDVELILRATRNVPLRDRLMRTVRRFAGLPRLHEQVKTLKVKGPDITTGLSREIDVLKDQLVFEENMMRVNARTRALDSESAYGTIEQVFRDNRESLLQAATIREL